MSRQTPERIDPDGPERVGGQKRSLTVYYTFGLIFTVILIAISAWLEPAEKGYGTHKQLGLPECSFKRLTGVPGPSCGLTTSFAHMTSGEVVQALRSNLFGVFLFALLVAGGIEAVVNLFWTRMSFLKWLARVSTPRYLFVLFVLWILSWILKLHIVAGNL